jgi:hypothetical protein
MKQPRASNSGRFAIHPLRTWFLGFLALLHCVGCATSHPRFSVERPHVARKLGVSGCIVSLPLSAPEVIANAKRDGNSRPEQNAEWTAIVSSLKPGDELRFVSCKGTNFFYGMFRDGRLLMKFYSSMVD